MTRVVILGAGPAGLAAALGLARRGLHPVVVEKRSSVGGSAGSFELRGVRVDYGSHRLHPAADPQVIETIRHLLGRALQERPHRGRIRLLARWLDLPLRPLNLAAQTRAHLALGVAMDLLRKLAPTRRRGEPETFASVLERRLGRTLCRHLHFPYAQKLWGLDPQEISATPAYRRAWPRSLGGLARGLLPGGARGRAVFYYPRDGYGQISEAYHGAATEAGADVRLGTRVRRVELGDHGLRVEVECGAASETLEADHVWSTVPLATLARMLDPPAPADVLQAADRLELRALLLVYLVLEQGRFTEYDTHYFPDLDIPFTRVSEPKNYAGRMDPVDRTVLCAEIPCSPSDPIWLFDEVTLGEFVRDGLARAGLPVRSRVADTAVRRMRAAYPIHRAGCEEHFERLTRWAEQLPGVLTFGRQGLHAHGHTHQALSMACGAVDCLREDGRFDSDRWKDHRAVFATHVVED